MSKWTERVSITILLAIVAAAFVGMYLTWSDCADAGGTTVRGIVGFECVHG